MLGIEMESSGIAPWDWTPAQLAAAPRLGAAHEMEYMASRPASQRVQLGHNEFSDAGKIDPAGWPGGMEGLRASIHAQIAAWSGTKPVPAPAPKPAVKPAAKPKPIDQLAAETLAGKHGNVEQRKKFLGASYAAVQAKINGSTGPSISQVADAVLRGKYGDSADRQRRLSASYAAVQAEVNRRYGAG